MSPVLLACMDAGRRGAQPPCGTAEISSGFACEISLECRAWLRSCCQLAGLQMRRPPCGEKRDRKLSFKIQNWRHAMKNRKGPLAIDLALELKEYW